MQLKAPAIKALWLAVGLAAAALGSMLLYRAANVFTADEETLPRFLPLAVHKPVSSLSVALPGRNPFDPTGTPWASVQADQSQANAGRLKGVVLFPGTQLVLTESGVVKLGANLAEGRLIAISPSGVLVDTAGRREQIPVPASKRIKLKDLNQGQPHAVAKELGRP
jgi:hypothetical protein